MTVFSSKFLPRISALVATVLAVSLSPLTPVSSASAANVAAGPSILSCEDGGACALGDVGPGGGKITFINQDNPIVEVIWHNDNSVVLKTQYSNNIQIGDSVHFQRDQPTVFSLTLTVVDVYDNLNFVVNVANKAQSDELATSYVPKAAGWDYLQFAPKGWSGQDSDPLGANRADIAATNSSLGTGWANTQTLLAGTVTDSANDSLNRIKKYGSEWFLPSVKEMETVGAVLGIDYNAMVANGLADYYETSSTAYLDTTCDNTTWWLYFTSQGFGGQYTFCSGVAYRPMRQLSNRVYLDPNHDSLSAPAFRTGFNIGETALPSLSRYGYKLDGWFTAPTGGSLVGLAGSKLDAKTTALGSTLFAHWSAATSYTVSFDGNGSTSGLVSSLTHTVGGSELGLPSGAALVRAGNTFVGWSETPAGTAIIGTYKPLANTTLYALWQPIVCSATFASGNPSDGIAPDNLLNATGEAFVLPLETGLSRPGYRLIGWSKILGGSAVSPLYCANTNDIALYAVWGPGTYRVTFDGNTQTTGLNPKPQAYTTGGARVVLPTGANLTKTGYTFGGWNDTVNTFAGGSNYITQRDVVLTAVWLPNRYLLAFDGGSDATGAAPDSITYTVGTPAPVLPNAGELTRTGYRFLGWSTQAANDFRDQTIVDADFVPTSRTTLYAVWGGYITCAQMGECNVGDVGPGGGKIIFVNHDIYMLSISAGGGEIRFETREPHRLIPGDRVNIAGSSRDDFNTYFRVTRVDSPTVFVSTWAGAEDVGSESGYVVRKAGWDYLQLAPADLMYGANSNDLNRTYATGSLLKNTSNSIGDGFSNTYLYLNATISDPSTDVATYMKLFGNGWFLPSSREMFEAGRVLASNAADAAANDFAEIYATSTVYDTGNYQGELRDLYFTNCPADGACAPFTGQSYYNTYWAFRPMREIVNASVLDYGYGRIATQRNSFIFGETAPDYELINPTRPGYDFTGWYDARVGGTFVGGAGAVMTKDSLPASTRLYAHWAERSYAVHFASTDKTGGSAPADISWLPSSGPIHLTPGTISRTGYSFAGWADGQGGVSVGTTYTPVSPITLYPIWEPNVYTVAFDATTYDSGSLPENAQYTVGDAGIALPTPSITRVGYRFAGWSKTDGGTVLTGQFQATEDTTLHAVWVAKAKVAPIKLATSLKRGATSKTIALVTANKTVIGVKATGRCSVVTVKKGKKVIGRAIKAAKTKGVCSVKFTVAETTDFAALLQVLNINVK